MPHPNAKHRSVVIPNLPVNATHTAEVHGNPAVLTRKVSQQNRSADGAKAHAIPMSLFRSAQLQGLNPVEHVLQLKRTTLEYNPAPTNDSKKPTKAV